MKLMISISLEVLTLDQNVLFIKEIVLIISRFLCSACVCVLVGYLNPFLEACSCEEFFRTASQLLKHHCLELPLLEKLSMLLQKLSSIR